MADELKTGSKFTVKFEVDIEVTDVVGFQTAAAVYAENAAGELAMVNATHVYSLVERYAVNQIVPRIMREAAPGAELSIGTMYPDRYVSLEEREVK